MVGLLHKYEEQYGIKITFSVENEPLDTGEQATPTGLIPLTPNTIENPDPYPVISFTQPDPSP